MDGNLIITNDGDDDYDDEGVQSAVIFLNGNIKTNNKRKTKKRHLNMRHENRMEFGTNFAQNETQKNRKRNMHFEKVIE
ncbi:hypothetical protein M0813_23484 [Anaeramoeba flamelloides]|uniref:Uncharacterized protein n=1 Tax=Anaeramoeba flamelloides TaxID=1746091 RepID=A0ABQ8YAK3_9EUKA|nr:hypothetical protein M0813_23484 [Anaeramoeba flamelloides]